MRILFTFCAVRRHLCGYERPKCRRRIEGAKNAIQVLGCELEEVKTFTLPDESKRAVLIIRRKKSFSGEFPRHGSKIAKKPL